MQSETPQPNQSIERDRPWQFGIGSLLRLTLWCAFVVALRPQERGPWKFNGFYVIEVFYFSVAAALTIEGVLALVAARVAADRESDWRADTYTGEVGALKCGIVGLLPVATIWLFFTLAESLGKVADLFAVAMVVFLGALLVVSIIPGICLPLISLTRYFGWQQNPALVLLRIVASFVNASLVLTIWSLLP